MEVPKIYKFTKEKYEPILVYFFVLPENDFLYFFELLKNKTGFVQDYCGYDVFDKYITFWEDSSSTKISVNITIQDFLLFIEPLILTIQKNKEKINLIIKEINDEIS